MTLRKVSLIGNIGAGKSTILQGLSLKRNVLVIDEPLGLIQNSPGVNFLNEYYCDPRKHASDFQLQVLDCYLQREEKWRKLTGDVKCIFDRSVREVGLFTRTLYKLRKIERRDYVYIMDKFVARTPPLNEKEECLVYLDVAPEICIQQMEKRARKEEIAGAQFTRDLIRQLDKEYKQMLAEGGIHSITCVEEMKTFLTKHNFI